MIIVSAEEFMSSTNECKGGFIIALCIVRCMIQCQAMRARVLVEKVVDDDYTPAEVPFLFYHYFIGCDRSFDSLRRLGGSLRALLSHLLSTLMRNPSILALPASAT